ISGEIQQSAYRIHRMSQSRLPDVETHLRPGRLRNQRFSAIFEAKEGKIMSENKLPPVAVTPLPLVAIRRALRGQPLPGRTIKLHTCGRCKRRYPPAAMAYGGVICKRCRAQAESASVEVMDEDEHEWC